MNLGILLPKLYFLIGQTKLNWKNRKVAQKFESKEEYFIENGGILLEKQMALSQGRNIEAGMLKILSKSEIEKATNNYDPDQIIGSFHGGTIYKGIFDDKVVAIRTPSKFDSNPELVNLFLTDVSIGMVICHNNMVKIYGCCLETCVPMMVYEFCPNNDLYRYLHGDMELRNLLKWRDRLRVATDTAYALSYMHNALSKPVVHRDVMSFGILLDSLYHAKLANFGHSVVITPGKKDQRWPVHGTPGYIDPEYIETEEVTKKKEVTEKCDVYSFGVLMLELLTSRDPVEMARCGNDLVDDFVSEMKRNGFKATIDMSLIEKGNIDGLQWFTRLALKCVARKGEERPSMIDVVEELWLMQDQSSKA
ncbi:wall-associated receptor kinase-like 1 [Silene latifolia]|uniref:wall-associated receptor kinase-like 1 n=1 Tax=Silene latifolia TaxID=37657 RepID=UPI003D772635